MRNSVVLTRILSSLAGKFHFAVWRDFKHESFFNQATFILKKNKRNYFLNYLDKISSKLKYVQCASSIQKVRCLKISCISGIFWWRIIFQLWSCISGLVFPDLFLVLNNFSITYYLQSLCILLQTRVCKRMIVLILVIC